MNKFFKNDIFTNSGDEYRLEYSPVVREDGTIDLEVSGKVNIQEEIDSFAEGCDLQNILARFKAGDLSALNRNIKKFGDFTEMPSTYAEVLQLQIDSNNLFNSLPTEFKEKFDNDANKFFAQSGSKEWFEIMSPLLDINKNNEESEVEVEE